MAKSDVVGQMIVNQIIALSKLNEEYAKKRDTAKTTLKKDYYNKKIKKVSEKAERLVFGLNNINTRRAVEAKAEETPTEQVEPDGEKLTDI